MIQGTTPTHTFTTSISLVDAEKVDVTYAQGKILWEKHKEDLEITDKAVIVKLTQEETFMFKTYGYKAQVQITAKWASDTPEGRVLKSNIMLIDVSRSIKKESI